MIERAPIDFDRAFDRWRDLLAAAERAVELATQTLNDYTITPQERKASESRLAMGNWQRKTLLQSASTQNNDFYLYRYLATEGFLPGYNFPRLPLMAYVQGSSDGKNQRYIQRARFLAISEFGPQNLVYHEGRAFRVDRALLKDAGDGPDGMLTTQSRAICKTCGAGHPGEHPEKCHVCGSALGGAILVHNLYRIENVGTRPAERITSNDEDRKRQGFELQTTFSFESAGSTSRQIVRDPKGEIATLDFAQAARISRINKGLRRRKDKEKVGFLINPKSGVWVGEKKENGDDDNRPDTLRQLVVPLVEDRKNALLLRFPGRWLAELGPENRTTLATIQHALARGMEAVFQLEEGEILVESPNARSGLCTTIRTASAKRKTIRTACPRSASLSVSPDATAASFPTSISPTMSRSIGATLPRYRSCFGLPMPLPPMPIEFGRPEHRMKHRLRTKNRSWSTA